MTDAALALIKKLNAIEAIARDMPAVGKRSELRAKADEIFLLLEDARQHVLALEKEIVSLQHEYPAQQFKRVKGAKRG